MRTRNLTGVADVIAGPPTPGEKEIVLYVATDGYDANSIVADPLFVNPTEDDYRLKPDSPAFKLGFEAIDVEIIGVRGYTRPAGLP